MVNAGAIVCTSLIKVKTRHDFSLFFFFFFPHFTWCQCSKKMLFQSLDLNHIDNLAVMMLSNCSLKPFAVNTAAVLLRPPSDRMVGLVIASCRRISNPRPLWRLVVMMKTADWPNYIFVLFSCRTISDASLVKREKQDWASPKCALKCEALRISAEFSPG